MKLFELLCLLVAQPYALAYVHDFTQFDEDGYLKEEWDTDEDDEDDGFYEEEDDDYEDLISDDKWE